jgi:hypothetical protein
LTEHNTHNAILVIVPQKCVAVLYPETREQCWNARTHPRLTQGEVRLWLVQIRLAMTHPQLLQHGLKHQTRAQIEDMRTSSSSIP